MRIYWHEHLFGPFGIGGTVWQSKRRSRRAPSWHGTLPGWQCSHNHQREDTARDCARREARRRAQ